jgi:hypothetical protein
VSPAELPDVVFTPDPELLEVPDAPNATVEPEVVTRSREPVPAAGWPSADEEIRLVHALHRLELLANGSVRVMRPDRGGLVVLSTEPSLELVKGVVSTFEPPPAAPGIRIEATAASSATGASSDEVLAESWRQVVPQRLAALDDMFTRIPPDAAWSLDTAATWQTMVRDFARDIEQASRSAHDTLAADFPASPGSSTAIAVRSISDARAALARLHVLCDRARDQDALSDASSQAQLAESLRLLAYQAAAFQDAWPLDADRRR